MAATHSRDNAGLTGNAVRATVIDHNALVADVALIRTAVNAIITAAGTSLAAIAAVTPAAAATATEVGDETGTAITA